MGTRSRIAGGILGIPWRGLSERARGIGRTLRTLPRAAFPSRPGSPPVPPLSAVFPTIPGAAAAPGPGQTRVGVGAGAEASAVLRAPSGKSRTRARLRGSRARVRPFPPRAPRQVPQSLVGNGRPPAGGAGDPARPGRRAAGERSGFWEPEFRTAGGGGSFLN